MKFSSFQKKNLLLILFLVFLSECNYKPLFDKNQVGQMSFSNIEVSGDKRTAQILINKLAINRDKTGKFTLNVDAEKNVRVSNKSASAKILEYQITLNYMIEIKENMNNRVVYSKKIENTQNFKPSNNYSDTINNEKKIIENISSLIAKQILNELSLVLRNDT